MLRFDADALNAYIRSSGDFCDPIARMEYAPHELMRLDRICKSSESLTDARSRLLKQREDSLVHQSILTALESELSSSISEAIELSPLPHASRLFKRDIMPIIVQCFDNLKTINEAESYRKIDDMYTAVVANEMLHENVELRETILALLFTLRMV